MNPCRGFWEELARATYPSEALHVTIAVCLAVGRGVRRGQGVGKRAPKTWDGSVSAVSTWIAVTKGVF